MKRISIINFLCNFVKLKYNSAILRTGNFFGRKDSFILNEDDLHNTAQWTKTNNFYYFIVRPPKLGGNKIVNFIDQIERRGRSSSNVELDLSDDQRRNAATADKSIRISIDLGTMKSEVMMSVISIDGGKDEKRNSKIADTIKLTLPLL